MLKMYWLSWVGPIPVATNINQEYNSLLDFKSLFGMNLLVFSPKYRSIALLSKIILSPSTIVGAFALGLILR